MQALLNTPFAGGPETQPPQADYFSAFAAARIFMAV